MVCIPPGIASAGGSFGEVYAVWKACFVVAVVPVSVAEGVVLVRRRQIILCCSYLTCSLLLIAD